MAGTSYRLSMPEPHSHLLVVEVELPEASGPTELVMPSWTPGSYLLREFARQVQDFEALSGGGAPLPWRKLDKSTWRVEARRGEPLRVRYRVYANELTVRTSHLDDSHAYVNGASVFMFVRGRESSPASLEVAAPAGWRVTTSLESSRPFRYRARDYDELVDSPLEIGTHERIEWEQSGIPHRYAVWGRGSYDAQRLVADTRVIIAATERLFGGLPYRAYTFILHLFPGGRGGLEHADSCSLQAERWAFEGDEYEQFLALVAHEFFHVWNAKRIRPDRLGAVDYTAENYTRSLWVVEGLTTYYTDLILRRAGLISQERYLARLADSIARLQALPGRGHQSLEESSFDSWIRFYRPDEHTPNAQISYYHKGALVGLLMDLEIRRATGNQRSLDDFMRLLWERYGRQNVGYPEESVQALAEEVAGESLQEFFDAYVRGTAELDYERSLAVAGLRLAREEMKPGAKGLSDAALLEARLGIRARDQAGRVQVVSVLTDTPAGRGGLYAGDECIALDGLRINTIAELAARVRRRAEGEPLQLTLFRRDELRTLELPVGPPPAAKLKLERVAEPTPEQAAVLQGWVGGAEGEASPSLDPDPRGG